MMPTMAMANKELPPFEVGVLSLRVVLVAIFACLLLFVCWLSHAGTTWMMIFVFFFLFILFPLF